MSYRLHETAIGSFIVYSGDRLLHETDSKEEAGQVCEHYRSAEGAYRKSGIGRALGEEYGDFHGRRARSVLASMSALMAESRELVSLCKPGDPLRATALKHHAESRERYRARLAMARRLP